MSDRDTDWILAMGHALGLDSGYRVPIVPTIDAFRDLFAEVQRRAAAELDRLNAQALELCAEISGLRRENESLQGLLSESRESVFQDIERMRESGVYEPDLGATIALLHNIDTYLTDGETDQADCCPQCGRSTKRHPGYVVGNHWLESAYERICAGEAEDDVLRDYDVVRITDQVPVEPGAK